jgi:hypothetical protein
MKIRKPYEGQKMLSAKEFMHHAVEEGMEVYANDKITSCELIKPAGRQNSNPFYALEQLIYLESALGFDADALPDKDAIEIVKGDLQNLIARVERWLSVYYMASSILDDTYQEKLDLHDGNIKLADDDIKNISSSGKTAQNIKEGLQKLGILPAELLVAEQELMWRSSLPRLPKRIVSQISPPFLKEAEIVQRVLSKINWIAQIIEVTNTPIEIKVLGKMRKCEICRTDFTPGRKNQVSCGKATCIKEHRNKRKREQRKRHLART